MFLSYKIICGVIPNIPHQLPRVRFVFSQKYLAVPSGKKPFPHTVTPSLPKRRTAKNKNISLLRKSFPLGSVEGLSNA